MKLPKNIIAPPRKGPVRERKSGAGTHAQGTRRQRSRSAARRSALSEQGA